MTEQTVAPPRLPPDTAPPLPFLLHWPVMAAVAAAALSTMGPTGILLFGLLFAADRLSGVLMPLLIIVGALTGAMCFPLIVAFALRRTAHGRLFALAVQWVTMILGAAFWGLWLLIDHLCGLSFTCF